MVATGLGPGRMMYVSGAGALLRLPAFGFGRVLARGVARAAFPLSKRVDEKIGAETWRYGAPVRATNRRTKTTKEAARVLC